MYVTYVRPQNRSNTAHNIFPFIINNTSKELILPNWSHESFVQSVANHIPSTPAGRLGSLRSYLTFQVEGRGFTGPRVTSW